MGTSFAPSPTERVVIRLSEARIRLTTSAFSAGVTRQQTTLLQVLEFTMKLSQ